MHTYICPCVAATAIRHVFNKPSPTFQRALWQAKEALRAKVQVVKETKEARAEEERVVRKWQASVGACVIAL